MTATGPVTSAEAAAPGGDPEAPDEGADRVEVQQRRGEAGALDREEGPPAIPSTMARMDCATLACSAVRTSRATMNIRLVAAVTDAEDEDGHHQRGAEGDAEQPGPGGEQDGGGDDAEDEAGAAPWPG